HERQQAVGELTRIVRRGIDGQNFVNQIDSACLLTYYFTPPVQLDVCFFELLYRGSHSGVDHLGALECASGVFVRAGQLSLECHASRRTFRWLVGAGHSRFQLAEPRLVLAVHALSDVLERAHRFLASAALEEPKISELEQRDRGEKPFGCARAEQLSRL